MPQPLSRSKTLPAQYIRFGARRGAARCGADRGGAKKFFRCGKVSIATQPVRFSFQMIVAPVICWLSQACFTASFFTGPTYQVQCSVVTCSAVQLVPAPSPLFLAVQSDPNNT